MVNSRDIDDLHPAVARGCRELIRRMALVGFVAVGISSTYRCGDYQDHLFAKGRTRPGNIVTQARGGQFIHNYRLAFDVFQNIRGREWNEPEFFAAAGRMWTELGGEWGGSWTGFVDRPHMQFTGGLTLRDLQNGQRLPDAVKMPWEKTAPAISPAPGSPVSEYNIYAMSLNSRNFNPYIQEKPCKHLA